MASESDFAPLFTLPRLSFGLRQLFLWTAAIALALVALRGASPAWIAAMMGLALFVLAASILLVVFRRGHQRAYWIGFATFGWLYMLLVLFSLTLGSNQPKNSPIRPNNLVTQRLSSACYHWLYDEAFERYHASSTMNHGAWYGGSMGGELYGVGPNGPLPAPGPNAGDFVNVAHSLWALLLAALGGCLAYWFYATGPGRTERPAAAT